METSNGQFIVKVNVVVLIFLGSLHHILSYQLFFGDCPVYYQEPCRPDMVRFLLSIRSGNATNYYQLDPYKPTLPKEFNVLTPLKVTIHGYGGPAIDRAVKNVTKAYQAKGYNVIIVDWGPLSSLPCYVPAYLNTWHVGQCLTRLTIGLIPLGLSPSFVHLVGFSLGAHIAGLAGAEMQELLGIKFQRITGLDPALPFFATLKNDWKLDCSDAAFVDIVHTSAGTFGKIEATGHVDFYVNGGVVQPFCADAPYTPLCSHAMAGVYFAESIDGNSHFIGRECENFANYVLGLCTGGRKAIMGEYTSHRTRGSYYVDTNDRPPFAKGQNRFSKNSRISQTKLQSIIGRTEFLRYFFRSHKLL